MGLEGCIVAIPGLWTTPRLVIGVNAPGVGAGPTTCGILALGTREGPAGAVVGVRG